MKPKQLPSPALALHNTLVLCGVMTLGDHTDPAGRELRHEFPQFVSLEGAR